MAGLSPSAGAQQGAVSAPESRVLDEANLFREHPARLEEASAALKRIEQKHGYSVYLAVYYNVLDGSVQERADALYKSWLGDNKRGLVVVVQQDPAVDGKNVAASYFRTSGLGEDAPLRLIPDREMDGLVAGAMRSGSGGQQDPVDRACAIASGLEKGIDNYYAVEPTEWRDGGNLKLMATVLAMIAAVGLLGALCWKRFTAAEAKSGHRHRFPEVDVAQRLGAPYGGGWVSEADFGPASSRK